MPIAPGEAPNSIDVLEQADALEQAGRFHDAAQALELLPRRDRDPVVDVRIVRLRHRAFSEGHDLANEPEGAGVPDDLWPTVTGAPEVSAGDVTLEKLRSAVYHHGCLIVRGLLPHDDCAQLRSDIDQAFTAFDERKPHQPIEAAAPWYAPLEVDPGFEAPDPLGTAFLREGGGVYAAYAPRAFIEYRNALTRAGLIDIVGAYLGTVPVLSVNKFVLRRISGGAQPSWHQDGCYLGVTTRAVNLWLSLSECGADTERMGMDIVPGPRHELAESGTFDAVDERAISQHIAERLARESGRPIERPLFREGDGILFDQFFIHRSDVRPLEQDRYAIESWFFSAEGFPRHLIPVVAG